MTYDIGLVSTLKIRSNKRRFSLTLLNLAAYLEYKGLNAKIIDIKSKPFFDIHKQIDKRTEIKLRKKIVAQIKKYNIKIVGLSAFTFEVQEVLEISKYIKDMCKGVIVVVGGVHASLLPEDFINPKSPVDYVILGEGEVTIVELIKTIKSKGDISKVKGIAYLSKGKMNKTLPRSYLASLEEIPPYPYHKLDMYYYSQPQTDGIRPFFISNADIITSRGCVSTCTFCCNKNLWKIQGANHGYVRHRKLEYVLKELETLIKDYKYDSIYVADDAFTLNRKYVFDFCSEIIRKKLKFIWACATKVNFVNEPLLRAMRKAGCIQIEFGIEAGNQKMLNRIKKGISIEQVKNAFKLCHKIGIKPWANFLLNCPGETVSDINDIKSLCKEIRPSGVSIGLLSPFPGTDLNEQLNIKLPIEKYHLYNEAVGKVVDKRLIMTEHNLDLTKVLNKISPELNPLSARLKSFLDYKYFSQIIRSKNKIAYLKQLPFLFGKVLYRFRLIR